MTDHPGHAGHPTDGWVECGCGSRHWGRHGAAGLLLGDPGGRVVMQHRATWSHHGGTWGLPGGALLPGESTVVGALRESAEEAGIDAVDVRPLATSVLTHPDWSYTTVVARAERELVVTAADPESLEVSWVAIDAVERLPLLPAFGEAWPVLRSMLTTDAHVVVDAANVVGSRPDGWWRDRAGAAQRLLQGVRVLAADGVPADLLGLPGRVWWPRWHVVLEGEARQDRQNRQGRGDRDDEQGTTADPLDVVDAPGSGDDAIVEVVRALAGDVVVVTADRGLRERVAALGARTVGPGALRDLVHG